MIGESRSYNQGVLIGCSVLVLLAMIAIGSTLIFAFEREHQAAQYPDSVLVSTHSNYKGLPSHFRWDDAYRTTDNFTDVYNWYSITFDLGAEARAHERCIELEGSYEQLFIERMTTVVVCNMPNGQMIFVSRSTSIK